MARRRGVTMIEMLIASLIFVLGIAALFSLWSFTFKQTEGGRKTSMGAELARADIEKAKAQTWTNLPTGTVSGTTGTYTGAVELYDIYGNRVEDTGYYSLQRVVTDTDVIAAASGTGYALTNESMRHVVTTVTTVSDGATVAQMGTTLVRGGL